MSIENEIAGLTQSTTDLLEAVNTKKSTLDSAVDTAEAAKVVATSKAAEATTVVADASTHATNASNSATQAAASAASASQIVTGVATGLPNIRPSLNLDFVNSGVVDPRIDFTRSATATYYDGKTVAKAEENVLPRSELFNDGAWTDAGLLRQADMAVAPNGTTTADHMLVKATDSAHRVYQNHAAYMGTDTYVTISVYAKANGYDFLGLSTGGNQGAVVFNLSTGVVDQVVGTVTSYGITDVGNGWYRCYLTDTSYSGTQPIFSVISQASATLDVFGSEVFLGDGISGIYLWGAQMENRDSLTAYTPTTDSPITNYVPVLQTAGINEPRLDHDPVTGECKGLLMEGARTNYVNNSSILSVADWNYFSGVTYQNNVAIAPDGTLTAGKVIPTGTGNRLGGHMSLHAQMVEGAVYTISGFYKHDGSYWTRVRLGGVFGNESATFDFTTGEFISTLSNVLRTSAVDVGNGWWRLAVTYVFQNSIGNLYPYALAGGCDSPSGTTPQDTAEYNGVYVWGMQYEKAYYPSSYIPTSGASVTRASDDAGIDFSQLNIGNEFSYVMSASKESATAGWSSYFKLRDTSNKNSTIASLNPSGNLYFETLHHGSNVGAYYRQYDFVDGQEVTIGGSLTNDQLIYDTSGSPVFTDVTGRSPVGVSLLYLGDSGNQHTKYFKIYSQAISASELEALTQE